MIRVAKRNGCCFDLVIAVLLVGFVFEKEYMILGFDFMLTHWAFIGFVVLGWEVVHW